MKHRNPIVSGLVLGLFAFPALAQEPEPVKQPEVTKPKQSKQDKQDKDKQDAAPAKRSTRELIEQLGDPAHKNRKAAEDQLRTLGQSAQKDLEAAAENHDDPEVRWRARRLADRIERGDADHEGNDQGLRARREAQQQQQQQPAPQWQGQYPWGRLQGGFVFPPPADLDQMFGSLFEQLERDFDLDIPRRQFFNDDFFRDLQGQMRDHVRGLQGGQVLGKGVTGESMSMTSGPDGVRVEIKRKAEDGKTETKVYEAPDMESFRTKYPEIADRHFGRGLGFHFGRVQIPQWDVQPWNVVPRAGRTPDSWVQVQPAEGERLGVNVTELDEEQRQQLELDEGVGLRVESVLEGSLAEKLGVAGGDVLIEVGGAKIGSPEDVRNALRKVEAGQKLKVTVGRDGAKKTLEVERPGRKDQGDAKAEPQGGVRNGKLKKREIK